MSYSLNELLQDDFTFVSESMVTPVSGVYTFAYNFLIDANSLILTDDYDTDAMGQDLDGQSSVYSIEYDTFSAFTTAQKNAAKVIMHEDGSYDYSYSVFFSDVTSIAFTSDTPQNADIVFGQVAWDSDGDGTSDDNTVGGYAKSGDPDEISAFESQFPNYSYSYDWNSGAHGDVWLNGAFTAGWSSVDEGGIQFYTLLHELAHSMGLVDFNDGVLDSHKFTIMSDDPLDGMVDGSTVVLPSGLQLYDIAALQDIYGSRNFDTRGSGALENTTYKQGQGFGATVNDPFIYTIWDGAGIDTIDASGYADKVTIDLRQGHFSSIGKAADTGFAGARGTGLVDDNVGIAFYTIIENATGTDEDDTLIGNEWSNVLDGGEGNDKLYGDGVTKDGATGFHKADSDRPMGEVEAASDDSGNDTLLGGDDDDELHGGRGYDILEAGDDNDQYFYDFLRSSVSGPAGSGVTTIRYTDDWVYIDEGVSTGTSDVVNVAGKAIADLTFYEHGSDLIIFLGESFSGGVLQHEGGIIIANGRNNSAIEALYFEVDDESVGRQYWDDTHGSYNPSDPDNLTVLTSIPGSLGSYFSAIKSEFTALTPDFNSLGETINGTSGADTLIGSVSGDALTGGSGADTVLSGDGDDSIDGEADNDVLLGEGGNDVLDGGAGDDELYGGEGDDILSAGEGTDVVHGGDGDDTLYGELGISDLWGDDGNDIIYMVEDSSQTSASDGRGGDGDDILYGGYIDDDVDPFIYGDAGNDTLVVTSGYHRLTMTGGTENDTFIMIAPTRDIADSKWISANDDWDGTQTVQFYEGYTWNDFLANILVYNGTSVSTWMLDDANPTKGLRLFLSQLDQATTGSLDSELQFETQAVGMFVSGDGDEVINGTDDGDLIVTAASLSSTVNAGAGDDFVGGGYNDDVLYAGSGADIIYGITGADELYGDAGDDYLDGDDGNDILDGGDGNDTLDGGDNNDSLSGGNGNDTLTAGDDDDMLDGGADDDTLKGGNGDDAYVFGVGDGSDYIEDNNGTSDSIIFNAGIDPNQLTFSVVNFNDLNVDYGADDFDIDQQLNGGGTRQIEWIQFSDGTVFSLANYASWSFGTSGADTPSLTASSDYYWGGAGDDDIDGGNGSDELAGGTGDDSMAGGAGDDVLMGGEGIDTADYSTVAAGVTVNLSTGSASNDGDGGSDTLTNVENVTGGSGNDSITGDSNANLLSGGSGNDTLSGGAGADVLDDGLGSDTLTGGSETDTFVITKEASATDTITDFEIGSEQVDLTDFDDIFDSFADLVAAMTQVSSDTEIALGGGQTLVLEGITATTLASMNFIGDVTNALPVLSNAGGSVDANTTLSVTTAMLDASDADNSDTELVFTVDTVPSHGTLKLDGVALSATDTFTVQDIIDNKITYVPDTNFDGSDSFDFTLSDGTATLSQDAFDITVNLVATITGTSGNDTKYGTSGDDVIDAMEGDDWISGLAGDDTYIFNAGDGDDYIFDNATSTNDVIRFGAGIEQSDISFAIINNDDLEITFDGTVTDRIVINNHIHFTVPAVIEKLVFADQSEIALIASVTGTSGNDVIYGTVGNDTLSGGDGNDTFHGNLGHDSVTGGDGDDLFVHEGDYGHAVGYSSFDGGAGTDTADFGNFGAAIKVDLTSISIEAQTRNGPDLSAGTWRDLVNLTNVEDIVGTAYLDDLKGSSGNNSLWGGAGNDTLNGYYGDDLLYGGDGNDTLTGSDGNDTLDGGEGNDTFSGNVGNDTFIYTGGLDSVTDNSGTDVLWLTGGVTVNDISFTNVSTYHTKITVASGTDEVTVNYLRHFNASNHVETILFDDGFYANLPTYNSWFNGTPGNDNIAGNGSANVLIGFAGNDDIDAGGGNDQAHGGAGADDIHGDAGDDLLHGGAGDDVLYGDDDFDTLFGGDGADTFVFAAATAFNDVDVISDFSTGESDAIDISDVLDGNYTYGVDVITDFVQITDNGTDSTLAVDQDGGADNFVAVATILGVTGLTDEAALESGGYLLAA